MNNKYHHIWIYISAFGIMFAFLTWMNEIRTEGFWIKGALAVITGYLLYRFIVKRLPDPNKKN